MIWARNLLEYLQLGYMSQLQYEDQYLVRYLGYI